MSYRSCILITGGTTGLGYQCALDLAKKQPKSQIIIASRSDKDSAAISINKILNQKNTFYLPLDLSSLAQVHAFVQGWESEKFPPIQALLLNAGLQFPQGLHLTKDGIEATFGVNHVGHALLFHLLFPHLQDGARIIVTSSGTHDPAQNSGMPDAKYTSGEELAHPAPVSPTTDGRGRYGTSKLANILWTYALDRRLATNKEKRITVNAFDPGLMPGTGLAREYSAVLRFLWEYVLPHVKPLVRIMFKTSNIHTTSESGQSLAWVAISDELKGVSGVYFEGRKEIKSSIDSYKVEDQEGLWQWTVKHVATDEEEARRFEALQ